MGIIWKELEWLFVCGIIIPVNRWFFYKQCIAIGDSWLSLCSCLAVIHVIA